MLHLKSDATPNHSKFDTMGETLAARKNLFWCWALWYLLF